MYYVDLGDSANDIKELFENMLQNITIKHAVLRNYYTVIEKN